MQAAAGVIDFVGKLTPRVQHRHDDFERGFFRKFRVRINRHAAPVVGHAQRAIGFQLHLDTVGEAGDGFVHRVIEYFGKQVVQRALIDAADIHPRSLAHRLKPFKDLNVFRRVAACGRGRCFAFAEQA